MAPSIKSPAPPQTLTEPEIPTMAELFGPGGMLEKCMPAGYEHRRSQLEMAELLDETFRTKRHLLVEAGTGTGKTLAYLIPAIRSGRRVIISTATKSLQEQLFAKDIPFVQKHFAPELKVAVMKGRANFLCRAKLQQMAGQPVLKGLEELDWFTQIRNWDQLTETGDRAELISYLTAPSCGASSTLAATLAPAKSAPISTAASSPPCTSALPTPT